MAKNTENNTDNTDTDNDDDDSPKKGWNTHRRFEARLRKLGKTLQGYENRFTTWGLADGARDAKTALVAVEGMVETLEALPDDWTAPKAPRKYGSRALDIGARVDIREKYRANYDGLLDDEDFTNLEVVKVAKGKVAVKLNSDKENDNWRPAVFGRREVQPVAKAAE